MLFFLDSADIEEVLELADACIIDGVTTNPSLFAKCNVDDFYSYAKNLCSIVNGPVSIEVVSTEYQDMISEGERVLDIAENVVLKLPTTWHGIKACSYFSSKGRDVNMTLCFSSSQALLAAKAGARYVSPFIGRVEDIGYDGINLISDICTIFKNYKNFNTLVLAASIRNVQHIVQSSLIGAHAITASGKLIKQLLHNPMTDIGIQTFCSDWSGSGLKLL